jgi:hypothetical protein
MKVVLVCQEILHLKIHHQLLTLRRRPGNGCPAEVGKEPTKDVPKNDVFGILPERSVIAKNGVKYCGCLTSHSGLVLTGAFLGRTGLEQRADSIILQGYVGAQT